MPPVDTDYKVTISTVSLPTYTETEERGAGKREYDNLYYCNLDGEIWRDLQ